MIRGIRHIALRVMDLERSLDFYRRMLDMKLEWRPDERNAYLTSGGDNLALHQVEGEPVAESRLDHFGFVVSTAEEVDSWAARLQAAGIELVQQPKTHRDGARSIYFHDPDGNLIQLLHHPHIN